MDSRHLRIILFHLGITWEFSNVSTFSWLLATNLHLCKITYVELLLEWSWLPHMLSLLTRYEFLYEIPERKIIFKYICRKCMFKVNNRNTNLLSRVSQKPSTEAYLKPWQIYQMKFFWKIVFWVLAVNYIYKTRRLRYLTEFWIRLCWGQVPI